MARPEALLPLAALGLLTGVLAGAVIIGFRLLVEGIQDLILPGAGPENYEGLPLPALFVLPLLAGVLLAVMFRYFSKGIHVLGIARVLERMARHQGACTPRAFALQFFGAAIAIIGGHSVGREGPHVFLGASAGSLLGQQLRLPSNVLRALVGCGTAAGIAASFNTPLAGVVFALEVVMMEYTVASFIPVILAAVSATTLTRLVFGDAPAFVLIDSDFNALGELLLVVLIGVLAGSCSAAFTHAVQKIASGLREVDIWWRVIVAGVLMGLIGMAVPEVMGIGYDTVDDVLNGRVAIGLLIVLLIAKLVATSICIGMGVPGGMIGPVLFMGAVLGALVAEVASLGPIPLETSIGLFALLGMGAMMSASLQAPLAALTAMLELTDNPEIILPGMLAVVVAGLTSTEVFGKSSLFLTMLRAAGLDYSEGPVAQTLRRIGVASVMNRDVAWVGARLSVEAARSVLGHQPIYLGVSDDDERQFVMPAAELANYLESDDVDDQQDIDLLEIPARRLESGNIDLSANLYEARQMFDDATVDMLVVRRMTAPGIFRRYGVITREKVDRSYHA